MAVAKRLTDAGEQEGLIVNPRTVGTYLAHDPSVKFGEGKPRIRLNQRVKAFAPELIAGLVHRLGQAVGQQDQKIPAFALDRVNRVALILAHA